MMENAFLFCLKSSFRSWDIEIIILTFSACRKNGFVRKVRLIWKFMTSQILLLKVWNHYYLDVIEVIKVAVMVK